MTCRSRWVILGLAVGIGLGVAAVLVPVPEATREDKRRAFAPYASIRVEGRPVAEVLRARTAVVVTGFDPRPVTWNEHALKFSIPPQVDASFAHAVVLTQDGYLLTCAHALDQVPVWVVVTAHGTWVTLPATVVWQGDDRVTATDAALLHVEAQGLDACPWGVVAPDVSLPHPRDATTIGSVLLCACAGFSAGHLRDTSREGEALVLLSDLPLAPGDSGAPIVDLQGRLLGIVVGMQFAVHGFRAEGVRPSPSRIAQCIATDRQARQRSLPASAAGALHPQEAARPVQ